MVDKLPLYLENLKVLRLLCWNFCGIDDLYLSVVRGWGHDNRFMWKISCQLHIGPQKFFPSIVSHRGTCALHEYMRYWNIHPQDFSHSGSVTTGLLSFGVSHYRTSLIRGHHSLFSRISSEFCISFPIILQKVLSISHPSLPSPSGKVQMSSGISLYCCSFISFFLVS